MRMLPLALTCCRNVLAIVLSVSTMAVAAEDERWTEANLQATPQVDDLQQDFVER